MPTWIIAAAIGSIAITAVLTLVLYRLNLPLLEQAKRDGAGTGDGADDGGSDSVGGDGGGGD